MENLFVIFKVFSQYAWEPCIWHIEQLHSNNARNGDMHP